MQINNSHELQAAIIELERRKAIQENILKEEFRATKESLRPINLIKSTFSKITHTPELKEGIFKAVAGVGIGLLTKNLFLGKAIPLVKTLIGQSVEHSVEKTVKTGADTVKAYGTAIYNNLFKKKAHL
jgi:hypothetical protein